MDVEVRDDLLIQAEAAAAEALKNPGAGRRIAEDVAARARECGAAEALVVALRAASWSARELYDHAAAEDLIAEAIEVAQDSALRSRLSEALVTRSTIHLEQGRVAMARRDIVDARHRALDENLPDVMFAEALLEGRAGNLRDAETAYARVVEVTRDRRPDITAKALNNWAIVCQKLGDLEEAEVKLRMVIDRAASFSDVMVAIATHNLAGVMGDAGRVVESLRLYDEAQERFESAGMTLGEHYLDKTQTLLSLRLLDEASRAVERAVAALDTPGASLLLAEALIFQARIAHEQGDFARSVEATDRASDALGRQQRPGFQAVAQLIGLEARVAAGDVSEEVVTALEAVCDELARTGHLGGQVDGHVLLGRVSNAIGDRERARASFMTAANAARRGPILTRLQGKLASASAAAVDGNVRALSRHARAGLDDLERYRGALASSELRARAAAYGMELAEMGLRAALRARRPLGVWAWLERTRASAIGGVVGGDRSPDLDPLLAQMREIRSRLRSPAELESDQQELYAAMTDVERRIREVGWQRPGSGTAGARPVTEAALDVHART